MTEHPAPEGSARTEEAGAVTVVIPTHNRLELLRQTLASVLAQTVPSRVIVVDDGSTDGTAAHLRSTEVEVVANPAGGWGPARARDEGLKRARTEFVAFLDSDDLLLPHALERLAGALRDAPAAPFAFGRSLIGCEDDGGWAPCGVIEPEPWELRRILPSLFARNFVPSVGTLVRRESAAGIGGYPRRSTWAEDHYFWLQLARQADPVFVPEITSIYRVHPGGRYDPALAAEDLEHFVALAAEDPRLSEALAQRLGVQLCETGAPALRQGDLAAAWKLARVCLAPSPARLATCRRAGQHWRRRRRWHRHGLRTWQVDPHVSELLRRYPWPESKPAGQVPSAA